MNTVLKIHKKDNVATCIQALQAGVPLEIDGISLVPKENIPIYHKIALTNIKNDSPVYKYGQVIGTATKDISIGEYVHIHNIESTRGRGDKKEGR